ncbi:hypothetical protein H4J02_06560 [Protaetiibacter sp. SSC-01]|uniref:hypothetical protein n=1 Tax=Protaetiibacter sp. SSC-01 TaxID=2759943 RepID=UPI001656C472|nr:hypothetical protein [Protaetiibacter sp. SSC-01]QNO38648.1 hypothetical protein H4J02_06560 [Protaetiibacter sp. SSC-01]
MATRHIENVGSSELNDEDDGTWRVTTASGTAYLLDLDKREGVRLPAGADTDSAALRRDGATFRLLALMACRMGEPAALLVDLSLPGVPMTTRITTEVTSITRLIDGH